MASFVHDLQSTYDGVVGAVRRSSLISSLFSSSHLGKHFAASDADYIVGDFVGVLGISLAVPLVRYLLQRALFQPAALRLVGGTVYAHTGRLPDKQRTRVAKFCESFWKMLIYGGLWALTLRAVSGEVWLRDTSYYWRDWPNHVPSVALRQVYCAELGFMVASVFMLIFWETRRKDFPVMMTHHVATITLIAVSYYLKFFRVGSMVLICHDLSDVLLEAAKLCKYCGAETASTAIFVAFMLSWALARLVYFPFWVIRSTLFESTAVLGFVIPLYYEFNALLLLLLVMHCYWFALIVRIAYGTVVSGHIDDVRENNSDSD